MGFWGWFWLIVVVGFGILSAWANANKAKEQGTALSAGDREDGGRIKEANFGLAGR